MSKIVWAHAHKITVLALKQEIGNIDDAASLGYGMLIFASPERRQEIAECFGREIARRVFAGTHEEAVHLIGKLRIPAVGPDSLWVPFGSMRTIREEMKVLASMRQRSREEMIPDDYVIGMDLAR